MTFIEYLQIRGISSDTPGPEGVVFTGIAELRPGITYREASLVFADIPVVSDVFEGLWHGYEDELDRQNYEREHNEPEHISVITGRVLYRLGK